MITQRRFYQSSYICCKCYQKYTSKKLFKLKTGISSRVISTIFGISNLSIKRAVAKVLNKNVVPNYLGCGHISRAEVIENHTRPLAQTFFGSGSEAILELKEHIFTFKRAETSNFKEGPIVHTKEDHL